MTAAARVEAETTTIVRPLREWEELINNDIKRGDEAGKEYHIAAGTKLIEVEDTNFFGRPKQEFWKWAAGPKGRFGKSREQLTQYMNMAFDTKRLEDRASARGGMSRGYKNLEDYRRKRGQHRPSKGRVSRGYQVPIDSILTKANTDAARIRQESLNRMEEREAQRKLALQLIDIGYRALSSRFHPDKQGGSKDAMTRLNIVRDRLKGSA
jgi:hypothetical protein